MKNALRLFGLIAIVALIGFSFAACGGDGGTKTKFEGSWYDRDPNNPTVNYLFFKFTGNEFLYQNYEGGQIYQSKPGTFTFTDSQITFIPPAPDTYTGWTTSYTLSGNQLYLENRGDGRNATVIKQ